MLIPDNNRLENHFICVVRATNSNFNVVIEIGRQAHSLINLCNYGILLLVIFIRIDLSKWQLPISIIGIPSWTLSRRPLSRAVQYPCIQCRFIYTTCLLVHELFSLNNKRYTDLHCLTNGELITGYRHNLKQNSSHLFTEILWVVVFGNFDAKCRRVSEWIILVYQTFIRIQSFSV